ncbi:MAG: DUF4405 domain-containing protein [Nanoarchaeota archaeon]
MAQPRTHYFLNLGMAIAFLLCFLTGLVKFPGLLLWLGINPGSMPLWQISRIHDWSGIALGAFVAVHLILHARWIAAMTKKVFGGKGS